MQTVPPPHRRLTFGGILSLCQADGFSIHRSALNQAIASGRLPPPPWASCGKRVFDETYYREHVREQFLHLRDRTA